MANNFLEAAIDYAQLGYKIFPLVPGKKIPKTAHGCLDATDDEARIIEWWTKTPDANIGVSTEGLVVIDVDGKDNPWLNEEQTRFSTLSIAPVQRTGNLGLQFFFRQPEGKRWRNTESRIAYRVDTRGLGGYCVIPPSVLDGDKQYGWIPEHEIVDRNELPFPPPSVIDLLDDIEKSRNVRFQGELKSGEPIPDGRRNSTLTSIGGYLRRAGFSESTISAALIDINNTRCQPPLPEKKVEGIAKSVTRYEPDNIAQIVAEGGVYLETAIRKYPHPGEMPQHIMLPGGLLQDIIEYNLSDAFRPQPKLALAGSVALMSAMTGRKITDYSGTQTNLYVISVAPPGAGKERSRDVAKELLYSAQWTELLGPESWGSSAGILSTLEENPVTLFLVDELGRYMKTITHASKSAPYLYNVITVLMKLFSSSGKVFIGDALADRAKVKKIYWPHCVVYGTTVPRVFYDSLTRDSLEDGFIARLLVFQSNNTPQAESPIKHAPPTNIIEAIQAWRDFRPSGGNLSEFHPIPKTLRYSRDAAALIASVVKQCDIERENDRDLGASWTRVAEMTKKLSLIHACGLSDPNELSTVGEASVRWASDLAVYLTKELLHTASEHIGESRRQIDTKKTLRIIRETGTDGLSRSELSWKLSYLDRKGRQDIVETLIEAGQILQVARKSKRGPKCVAYVTPENFNLLEQFQEEKSDGEKPSEKRNSS